MRPIADLLPAVAARVRAVLFDVDDTVLDHGRLSTRSLDAMYRLKDNGMLLVGVTGRPVTWGQVLVRQWPLDGMVTENGALAVTQKENRVLTLDRLTRHQREARRAQLLMLVTGLRQQFPDIQPSDDAESRIGDYTLDIGETTIVSSHVVAEVTSYARLHGARVTRSSIHLHLSLDVDDKATGVLRFLSQEYGMDPTVGRYHCAFIGDSENDSPCFAAFDTTVCVANFRGRPSLPPRYITQGKMGTGFAEFAERLLLARSLGA